MKEKQYVQHISGQGEKWELSGKLYNQEDNKDWQVIAKNDPSPFNYHYLPKSEYRLCEPPEVWRDVTEEFLECHDSRDMPNKFVGGIQDKKGRMFFEPNPFYSVGYRLRKVNITVGSPREGVSQWAFIVEQKVTE